MDIGTALRLSRAYKRETQIKAAMHLNVSPATLRQYESGQRAVPPDVIARSVDHYGLTPWLREALEELPLARVYRMMYAPSQPIRKAS